MTKKLLSLVARLTLHYPGTILTICLALTVGSSFLMFRLRLLSDVTALLPPSFESVQNLRTLRDEFGQGALIMGVVEGPRDASLKFMEELSRSLEKLPEVDRVDYRKPLDFFMRHGALYLSADDLEEVLRRVRKARDALEQGASPVFDRVLNFYEEEETPFHFDDIEKKYTQRGLLPARPTEPYFISGDGRTAAFLLRTQVPMFQNEAAQAFIDTIRQTVEGLRGGNLLYSPLKVHLTGDLIVTMEESERLKKEIVSTSILVIVLIGLLILLWYKRFYSLLLITTPFVLGLVWTGALTYLLIGHINLVTSFTSGVLMGLGSDYGIYLLSRFFDESDGKKKFEEAFVKTFTNTSRALVSACVTTIAVFLLLILPDFRGFSEFGVIGAMGTAINLFLMFLIFPALLVLCHHRGWLEPGHGRFEFTSLYRRFNFFPNFLSSKGATGVVALFLALSVLSLYLGKDLLVLEHDLNKFQDYWPPLPSLAWQKKGSEILGPGFKPTVVIADNASEEKELMRSLQERINGQESERIIHDAVSLDTLVPEGQERKILLIRRIQRDIRLLEPKYRQEATFFLDQAARPITESDIPPEIRKHFLAKDLSSTKRLILIHPAIRRDNREAIEKFASMVRGLPAGPGKTVSASGDVLVVADILALIDRESVRLLFLCFGVLFLIVLVDLKDWWGTFGVMTALSVGLALTLGFMKLFGIRFNILNIALIPVILGTEIDGFLHFYHRLVEGDNHDPWETLSRMAPPITLSCLTTLVGFGAFVLTGNAGLQSIGLLALVGISAIYLTCLLFYPALIVLLERTPSLVRRVRAEKELGPQGVTES